MHSSDKNYGQSMVKPIPLDYQPELTCSSTGSGQLNHIKI